MLCWTYTSDCVKGTSSQLCTEQGTDQCIPAGGEAACTPQMTPTKVTASHRRPLGIIVDFGRPGTFNCKAMLADSGALWLRSLLWMFVMLVSEALDLARSHSIASNF